NGVADTINLAANCTYTFTTGDATNPDSALPRITTPIVINGNGATIERADGSPYFRLLYVTNSGDLTLNHITVRGGSATSGGGIYIAGGILTVTNTTFSDNDANSMGGGIYNMAGSTLTVSNSVFSGNSAYSYGGAIRSD